MAMSIMLISIAIGLGGAVVIGISSSFAFMSLLTALRAGVAVAAQVTSPLQALVAYERCLGSDAYGQRIFAAPVTLHAIEDWRSQQVRTKDGILTATRATLLFLNIAEVVAATGGAGFSEEDRYTLSDGSSGPVLDLAGFVDAGTTHPLATTILMG